MRSSPNSSSAAFIASLNNRTAILQPNDLRAAEHMGGLCPPFKRFTSRYRGKRDSLGYPACPHLEDQAGWWTLLQPDEIGVKLTDGFMKDP